MSDKTSERAQALQLSHRKTLIEEVKEVEEVEALAEAVLELLEARVSKSARERTASVRIALPPCALMLVFSQLCHDAHHGAELPHLSSPCLLCLEPLACLMCLC